MTNPMHLVSTFSTEFFRGNPAAVVVLDGERDTEWYARVAALMGQPVTAFCRPIDGGYGLRWFTPARELELCGHGTLAAAHVLYETAAVPADQTIRFTTQTAALAVRSEDGVRWLSLAAVPLTEAPVPPEVLAGLGLEAAEWYGWSSDDLVVVVDSPERVERLRPDFGLLAQLPTTRTIVTAAGGDGVDFTSRVFPPRIGLVEDQVTGTAHAALGPYWAGRLGRVRLTARQASARGGQLQLSLATEGIVEIGGRVTSVASGALLV
jgi:PhzF family phenazine biosynthesis protein